MQMCGAQSQLTHVQSIGRLWASGILGEEEVKIVRPRGLRTLLWNYVSYKVSPTKAELNKDNRHASVHWVGKTVRTQLCMKSYKQLRNARRGETHTLSLSLHTLLCVSNTHSLSSHTLLCVSNTHTCTLSLCHTRSCVSQTHTHSLSLSCHTHTLISHTLSYTHTQCINNN